MIVVITGRVPGRCILLSCTGIVSMDGRRLGMAENDTGQQPLGVMVFVIGWGQTSEPSGPMGLGRGLWQALQWHAHGIAATSTASHSEIRTGCESARDPRGDGLPGWRQPPTRQVFFIAMPT